MPQPGETNPLLRPGLEPPLGALYAMYKNTGMLCSLVDEKFSCLCSFLQSFYKVRDCSNIHRHEGTNAKLMVRGLIEGGGGLKAN